MDLNSSSTMVLLCGVEPVYTLTKYESSKSNGGDDVSLERAEDLRSK